MRQRSFVSVAVWATLAAIIVAIAFLAPAAVGQTQKTTKPLRTPDGKPDLQGVWSDNTLTPLERPRKLGAKEFYTDAEFADLTRRARSGEKVEEADLGAGAPRAVRYELGVYGFNRYKLGLCITQVS